MRKEITALMMAGALTAFAEGYQVNTFSARQEGMGHVGVAMKLGAESQIFNPGALAFSEKRFEISGSVSAIKASATATVDGTGYDTSNKVSTPMNFSAAFRIYDNLYAGVTFYTPYGSSINWGKTWPGSVLSESVDLKMFTVQPTVSWRVLPNLSVGAGLMIGWGSVNLNKGMVTGAAMDRLLELQYAAAMLQHTVGSLTGNPGGAPVPATYKYGNIPPASVNLNGSSELALGVNAGVMWDINSQWSVGASFRSKMNMHVKAGSASVEYADEMARQVLGATLDNLNYTDFDASMPCPYVFTAGVSYKPVERLTLAFDAQLNGWNAYKWLDISFADLEAFNQHLEKNYRNAMTYHFGVQYVTTERLDLRAGLMVDTSPCDRNFYNPETPGMTKWEPSVGLSFRPVEGLSIDLAFMYVFGSGLKNGSVTYDNLLAGTFNSGLEQYRAGVQQFNGVLGSLGLPSYPAADIQPMEARQRFSADYKVHALIPAIGISYSF